jgi:hypothetical protein
MTKADKLELLMLLSALESWSFADKHMMPDYLYDRLDKAIIRLTGEILTPDTYQFTTEAKAFKEFDNDPD